ncbi:MAG TPA: GNAT family N-acetyltransferase [Sphingobium sp.]|nr:GNAT family N-acetyltransferase [Sphingobium sp.]
MPEVRIDARGRVRPMARHDVPVAAALVARLCLARGAAPCLDAAALEAGLRSPASQLHGLVAERFGYVVGYALTESRADGALDLQQLFVMEGSRGLGLGRALVAAVVAMARDAGCRSIIARPPLASVHARGFYAALGFGTDDAAPGCYRRALP